MISELYEITVPAINTIIKKTYNDKSISHNIIYEDVAKNVTTKATFDRSLTCQLQFRKEIYDELGEMLIKKYNDLQRKLYEIEENKKRLKIKRIKFKKLIKDSVPFIEENNCRYIKTMAFIKNDIKIARMKTNELEEIKKEISSLTKRKDFFIAANKQLRNYENFLLDVLNILPTDYVKGLKENNLNALVRRYKSLLFMNRVISADLNRSSTMLRKLIKDLNTCHQRMSSLQSQQSIIFPQMNNQLFKVQNELSITMRNYNESYSELRKKMHVFGIVLRSLNNITNKVYQIMEKGFVCELETNLDHQVLIMDPDTKFQRIEDFIDYTLLILDIVEFKQSLLS